jgi:hypothetical protein
MSHAFRLVPRHKRLIRSNGETSFHADARPRRSSTPDPQGPEQGKWSRLGESNPRPTHYEFSAHRIRCAHPVHPCTSGWTRRSEPDTVRLHFVPRTASRRRSTRLLSQSSPSDRAAHCERRPVGLGRSNLRIPCASFVGSSHERCLPETNRGSRFRAARSALRSEGSRRCAGSD